MLRSMMQMYIKGSVGAVKFYQKAFNAKLISEYKNDDGSYLHAELNAYGQVLALSEASEEIKTGNAMQFCFHFDKSNIKNVETAYEILKEGAEIQVPLGPSFYSPCMFSLIDRFGIKWCLFV